MTPTDSTYAYSHTSTLGRSDDVEHPGDDGNVVASRDRQARCSTGAAIDVLVGMSEGSPEPSRPDGSRCGRKKVLRKWCQVPPLRAGMSSSIRACREERDEDHTARPRAPLKLLSVNKGSFHGAQDDPDWSDGARIRHSRAGRRNTQPVTVIERRSRTGAAPDLCPAGWRSHGHAGSGTDGGGSRAAGGAAGRANHSGRDLTGGEHPGRSAACRHRIRSGADTLGADIIATIEVGARGQVPRQQLDRSPHRSRAAPPRHLLVSCQR